MSKFFSSDQHFGHTQIIEYAKRPFSSLEEMHEKLISNWNECVKPKDTIFVVGDLSFMHQKDFGNVASRLQGNKILIRGNHDRYNIGTYVKYGFTVYEEVMMKLAGQKVRLSHYPYAYPWYKRPFAFKSELRFMERRPKKVKDEFLIHGHTHTKKRMINNMIHAGVEAWNYYPVSESEIESLMMRYIRG